MSNLVVNEFSEINLSDYIDLEGLNDDQISVITEYALELAQNGEDIDFIVQTLERLVTELKKSFALYSKGSELARKLAREAFLSR